MKKSPYPSELEMIGRLAYLEHGIRLGVSREALLTGGHDPAIIYPLREFPQRPLKSTGGDTSSNDRSASSADTSAHQPVLQSIPTAASTPPTPQNAAERRPEPTRDLVMEAILAANKIPGSPDQTARWLPRSILHRDLSKSWEELGRLVCPVRSQKTARGLHGILAVGSCLILATALCLIKRNPSS